MPEIVSNGSGVAAAPAEANCAPEACQREESDTAMVLSSPPIVRASSSLSETSSVHSAEMAVDSQSRPELVTATEGASTAQQPTAENHNHLHAGPTGRRKESLFQRIKKQKLGTKDLAASESSPAISRRTPNWRTKWMVSSYNSRNEGFRKLFGEFITADEILIDDFSCALHKEILQQGRLYLSRDHLCFHANIFGFETRLAIRWENIQAVTREKTAMVFPNALQITVLSPEAESETKQYFFSSFVRRELTHAIAMKVWQNKLLGEPESTAELRRFVCDRYGIDIDAMVSDGDDEDGEEEEVAKADSIDDVIGHAGEVSDANSEASSLSSSSFEELCPVQCTCSGHVDQVFIDDEFNMGVDDLFQLFFADGEPSPFMKAWVEQRHLTDYVQPQWNEVDGGGGGGTLRSRAITFVMPMELKMGPKTSATTEVQTVYCDRPGQAYRVEVEVSNAGIPYADTFYTYVEYCLTRVSRHSARLRVGACTRYRKSCFSMIKTMIERSAAEGMKQHHDKLRQHLLDTCSSPGGIVASASAAPLSAPRSGSPSRSASALGDKGQPRAGAYVRGTSTTSTHTVTLLSSAAAAPPSHLAPLLVAPPAAPAASSGSRSAWFVQALVVFLLLLNLFFLVSIYARQRDDGLPSMLLPSSDHFLRADVERLSATSQQLDSNMGSLEEWRSLLDVQHKTHRQEMERIRLTLTTSSRVLSRVVGTLEKYVDLAVTPAVSVGGSASTAPATCSGDSCPEDVGSGDQTLDQTIAALLALQKEVSSHSSPPSDQ